jgi:hypothetical protein
MDGSDSEDGEFDVGAAERCVCCSCLLYLGTAVVLMLVACRQIEKEEEQSADDSAGDDDEESELEEELDEDELKVELPSD